MNRKQKPVLIVGIVLIGLIFMPVVFLALSKFGGSSESGSSEVKGAPRSLGAVADFDLRQLADRAQQLMDGELTLAVQNRDISLEFIGGLRQQLSRAQSDLTSGKVSRAQSRFDAFISNAEDKLEEIALAEKARELKDATYQELERLDSLRSTFRNTFEEAVETYDSASRQLGAGALAESVDGFELVQAILGDLEARSIQQIATLLEQAQLALESFDLEAAQAAFERVLEMKPDHAEALEGLEQTAALKGIDDEIRAILAIEAEGRIDDALLELEQLATRHPENRYVQQLRHGMQAKQVEANFSRLVEESIRLEKGGDLVGAIGMLEEALALKEDQEAILRLNGLKERLKAIRLEELLAGGFADLQSGRYESARDRYKDAVALAPESSEARTGLEKASSLFLATVRYSQSINGVERRIAEGRFPLAAKLFNEALKSRPAVLSGDAKRKEESVRSALEVQSREVVMKLTSDRRTHVSIIGVLPPERFRSKDLTLFPDVYKVRGTRQGYRAVEIELKVDALKIGQSLHIQCTERIL